MPDANVAFIKSLMDEFSSSPLAELTVRTGDFEVRMVRASSAGRPDASEPATAKGGGAFLEAPFSGIIYLTPSPEELPFASPGQSFAAGDILLLCEAMKTMTPVPAPEAGEVEAVLVENGAYVEAGERLLRYRPARS